MKVFFDVSIIIAAILSKTGGSALLFEYIKIDKIIGISSLTAIDEILEDDKSKKLNKSKEELEKFIASSGLLIRERINSQNITPYRGMIDIEDAHLIAGAKLTKCEYLVTLDKKRLLREDIQKRFLPLQIISPKELLEKIIND